MRKVFLPLSQEDIDEGRKGDAKLCPVAIAIKGHENYETAAVSSQGVYLEELATPRSLRTTQTLRRLIVAFDAGKIIKPGEIKIDYENKTVDYKEDTDG